MSVILSHVTPLWTNFADFPAPASRPISRVQGWSLEIPEVFQASAGLVVALRGQGLVRVFGMLDPNDTSTMFLLVEASADADEQTAQDADPQPGRPTTARYDGWLPPYLYVVGAATTAAAPTANVHVWTATPLTATETIGLSSLDPNI